MSKQRSDRFPTTSAFFEALSGGAPALGEQSGAGASTISDRGARAAAAGAGASPRLKTPQASAPPFATRPAGAAASAMVDSIDAMVQARTRRRRVTAFAIGVGVAMLLAATVPALRNAWWPSSSGAGSQGSAQTPAEPAVGPNRLAAPSPPAGSGPVGDPERPTPSPGPPTTPSTATGEVAPAGGARTAGGPAPTRAARPVKRHGADAEAAAVVPGDKPKPAAADRPTVGRLVEEL